MQAATRLHCSYQQGPQDYELKRQYLALLPPQQIIDICLAFDVHVPYYIRSTVWPLDINAAIAALNKTQGLSQPTSLTAKANDVPVMDSLRDPQESTHDKPPVTTPLSVVHVPPAQSSSSDSAVAPSSSKQSPAHNLFVYPSQPAYPHAPYYPPPPAGYPPYPHLYPAYHPSPLGYPPHPSFSAGSTSQPHDPYSTQSTDDLPNYEEMIVEALTESSDPEGSAPKDLFTWMASRYPLQSNFRPSASQALQKAYKRGRFEKTSGGKYKLSATWEGGNTSRRTTRRPQTQTQTQASAPSTSILTPPFTQTPLVHHRLQQPGLRPTYSGHHSSLQASAQPPSSDKDAYETAQNILKAINFGGLLRLSTEKDEVHMVDSTTRENVAAAATASGTGVPPNIPSNKDTTTSGTVMKNKDLTASRAELQARLVLLAGQLEEIARDKQPEQGVTDERLQAASGPEEDDNDEEMEAVIVI